MFASTSRPEQRDPNPDGDDRYYACVSEAKYFGGGLAMASFPENGSQARAEDNDHRHEERHLAGYQLADKTGKPI
jgi:hypothetical protein